MKKPIDVEEMFPQIAHIGDSTLRENVEAIWQELWEQSEFTDIATVPTSGAIPYPNLPHSRAILDLCLAAAGVFEEYHGVRTDRDTLIAAAILQDASKVVEYRPTADGKGIEKTDIGETYPHAFWTAMLAQRRGVPQSVIHVILTHTPQATKFPDSLEGKILYYIDQLDVIAIHKDRWKKELVVKR